MTHTFPEGRSDPLNIRDAFTNRTSVKTLQKFNTNQCQYFKMFYSNLKTVLTSHVHLEMFTLVTKDLDIKRR